MTGTVLVLGASGRYGRNVATAFETAGWDVRRFDRKTDDLLQAATGADIIVSAWNPPYPEWASMVARLHDKVIKVALRTGATVVLPGNVYVFGPQTPAPWGPTSPRRANNPLGRVRIHMEDAYRRAGVRTILLRAGDFIDTQPSGNWFDKVLTKQLSKGVFTYPGRPDIAHAWAFLPDMARATVQLAEQRADLPVFNDICFPGYTLSGQDMAAALSRPLARPVVLKPMSWLPLQLTRPVWPMARCLLEMRYLWDTPHWLTDPQFDRLLPGFQATPVDSALAIAVGADQSSSRSTQTSR